MKLTLKQQAAFFRCSEEAILKQHRKNLLGLVEMRTKARLTHRKVNGFTADQLTRMIDQTQALLTQEAP
jgi:hypothetical protein